MRKIIIAFCIASDLHQSAEVAGMEGSYVSNAIQQLMHDMLKGNIKPSQ